MIPKECKRLAEADFPIAVVSKDSAREKSIRHGHPPTLHLWWEWGPLAACRAMLLGLHFPDPCDPHCPSDFKARAPKALLDVPGWDNSRRREQETSKNPARFTWHEVTEVQHYWLGVSAMIELMQVKEGSPLYGVRRDSLRSPTSPPMTEEIAMNCVRDFFREKPFVFFGTGMSCALDKRFGMPALQEHLSRSVVSEAQPSEQAQQKPPAALPDHGGGAENPEGGHALMNSLPENTFKNADRISWHEVTEVAHCWIDAATFTKPFKG